MCEEYTEFIPKNEVAQLIYPLEKKDTNNASNKNNNEKEEPADKELLEEYTYLKDLYRLNYLTFSPFALEYFEKMNDPKKKNNKFNQKESNINNINKSNRSINNNIKKMNEDNNNNYSNNKYSKKILNLENNFNNKNSNKNLNMENNEEINDEQKEKDNKLLKLLNFDYNNFELNNDLLFNISQGFIDISKLKESNLKMNEKNKDYKENSNSGDSSKEDEFEVFEYDEELNQELIDKIMNFVKNFEKNLLLKRAIAKFKDELSKLPPKCKNKVKNDFYRHWDYEFAKLEKDNERLIKRKDDEERKQKLLKQKMYLDRLKREKEENEEEKKMFDKQDEFINQLRKIQNNV